MKTVTITKPTNTQNKINKLIPCLGLDDLKDYAVALTDATGLSQAQRDDVAEKLARDLLDEMRVMDGRKQQLLEELMSFVTAMEVSTFKGIFFIFYRPKLVIKHTFTFPPVVRLG